MKLRKEHSIAVVFDAVSISKDIEVIGGPNSLNYYADSNTFIPNRFLTPLLLKPIVYVADPNKVISDGNKFEELTECTWYENGKQIFTGDDYVINKNNTLTVKKNSQVDLDISYSAKWFDPRKKQSISIEDSITLVSISLAESAFNPRLTLSKPLNWIHNPLKGERVYTINAYISTDKVYEGAVEWYYIGKDKKEILIDEKCLFYEGGQYTNALDVNSDYLNNCIIKAKNISKDKLKEIYWFFNDLGNPITHKEPEQTKIKGTDIFNIPENAMKSVVPNYRIEGLTVQNLVKNGDFREGVKYWTSSEYRLEVVNNKLLGKIRASGTTSVFLANYFSKTVREGDKIYINTKVSFREGEEPSTINARLIESETGKALTSNNEININQRVTHILNVRSNSDKAILNFQIWYREGVSIDYEVEVDVTSIYNLTQMFGAGNEPSKEWCDEHIQGYFEGTKSVQLPLRVKSVGENLCEVYEKGTILGKRLNKAFKIEDNKIIRTTRGGYHKSLFDGYNGNGASVDVSKAPFLRAGSSIFINNSASSVSTSLHNIDGSIKLETKDNRTPIFYYIEEDCYLNINMVLDKKDSFIEDLYISKIENVEFSPYKESLAYFNDEVELSSIGTVKDFIENGKLYKNVNTTKNINVLTISTKYDSVNVAIIRLPENYQNSPSSVYIEGLRETKALPTEDSEPSTFYCSSGSFGARIIGVYVEKSITTVESFKEKYSIEEIQYKLNETEVINLDIVGNIKTESNGTVFIEPVTYTEQQYNDGIKTKFPIVEIESIKVGTKYLDVSKAVIKDNLITHSDLENGDFVTVTYYYDSNPIYGENEIGYLDIQSLLDVLWLDDIYTYRAKLDSNGKPTEWELVKLTDIENYEEWLSQRKESPYALAPDGIIFGDYSASTKFLRQFPSSLYVDIIIPNRLKDRATQVKARALVGTKDYIIDNPSKYFKITWLKRANKAGAEEEIIGYGEEIIIDAQSKDAITIEIEDLGTYKAMTDENGKYLFNEENKLITAR